MEKFVKLKIYQEGGLHIGEYTFIDQEQEVTLMDFMEDLQKLCKDSLIEENANNKALLNSSVVTDIKSPKSEEEFKQRYDRFRVDALQGNILKLWNAANANDPIAQYALTQYYLFDILEEAIRKDEEKVFSVVLQEVETIGKRSDYAVYLKNELEYERKNINGRTSRYGIDKNMQEIIELAKKENACIAAVAEAGRYLCLFDNDELVKKGRKYLEDTAEQYEPSAMVNYGEYLIKQSEQGVAVDRQCAARYIKLAVYAQERHALFLNNHYKFGYERSGLREFHILENKRSFIDDGSIRMIDFPNTLYVHYGTRFKAWPEDVLMNGGNQWSESKIGFCKRVF